jgi:hypothetical protein
VVLSAYDAGYLGFWQPRPKIQVPSLTTSIKIILEAQPTLDARDEKDWRWREDIYARLEKMGVKARRPEEDVEN